MKAFVVLCVLVGSVLTDEQPHEMCTPGVCGCCLINKQLRRDDVNFHELYDRMSTDLSSITETLDNIKAARSIFSAILQSSQNCTDPDPADSDTPVVYNTVSVNLGDDYDISTGEYTVPLDGVYSFAVSLYNKGHYHSCAALEIDGVQEYMLMESNNDDMQDSASFSKIFTLYAGQKVQVIQPEGCYMCAQNNRFNTFTGYLLYASA